MNVHRKNSNPFYLYSHRILKSRTNQFAQEIKKSLKGPHRIFYALKANNNPTVLNIMKKQGFGMDVVSGGEFQKSLKSGFRPEQIIFSGVGKSIEEIESAIDLGIFQLNVESLPELERIGKIALRKRKKAAIALRINPEVNPKTHPYIATGMRENKFGISVDQLPEALEILHRYTDLQLRGFSLHIGSQLFDFSALSMAIAKAKSIYYDFLEMGYPLQTFDIGGGVGIPYDQTSEKDALVLEKFCKVLSRQFGKVGDKSTFENKSYSMNSLLREFPAEILFEPGRFLVARAGLLMTQVQYVKRTPYKTFVIVNTGMNHLLRPALYQAEHRILPLKIRPKKFQNVDIVGPVCESSDFLGRQRKLCPLEEGDWLAIADVGAYGFVMSSDYNSFQKPDEVWID